MTAADRSLQRRTGYRCHSAPSCSVAQAWVSGGAKVDDDRKLRVPGGGGGDRQVDVLGAVFLLDGNVHWLIRFADPGSLCQPLWALGHLPGPSPSCRAFQYRGLRPVKGPAARAIRKGNGFTAACNVNMSPLTTCMSFSCDKSVCDDVCHARHATPAWPSPLETGLQFLHWICNGGLKRGPEGRSVLNKRYQKVEPFCFRTQVTQPSGHPTARTRTVGQPVYPRHAGPITVVLPRVAPPPQPPKLQRKL